MTTRLMDMLIGKQFDDAKLLLTTGYDPMTEGMTPLMLSCAFGEDITNILYLDGDINAKSVDDWTALMWSCLHDNTDTYSLLMDRGADLQSISSTEKYPAMICSMFGCLKVLELMCLDGADITVPECTGWTCLMWACGLGHFSLVLFLLNFTTADVTVTDNYNFTCLMSACTNGHLCIVQQLLSCEGVCVHDRDDYGRTCLMFACSRGQFAVVCELMNHGAKVSDTSGGRTCLMMACKGSGNIQVIQHLLCCDGICVDARDDKEWTCLMYACSRGHLEVVLMLIRLYNCYSTDFNNQNSTCLMIACRKEHLNVVKILASMEGISID